MTDRERMKGKLKEYLDIILADAPAGTRTEELRTELYQNMCDKYDDLISEGKTSAVAYNAVVAGLGDISPLLNGSADHPSATTTLVGDSDSEAAGSESGRARAKEQRATLQRYRRRSAILIPTAVVLYILSVLPVILMDDYRENLGIVCMFGMVAIATGILIFNHMSRPIACPDRQAGEHENEAARKEEEPSSPRQSLYKAISGALWILTVLAYLSVSFLTMRWELTWMIFLIAVAIDNIVKAIFDLAT